MCVRHGRELQPSLRTDSCIYSRDLHFPWKREKGNEVLVRKSTKVLQELYFTLVIEMCFKPKTCADIFHLLYFFFLLKNRLLWLSRFSFSLQQKKNRLCMHNFKLFKFHCPKKWLFSFPTRRSNKFYAVKAGSATSFIGFFTSFCSPRMFYDDYFFLSLFSLSFFLPFFFFFFFTTHLPEGDCSNNAGALLNAVRKNHQYLMASQY